MSRRTRDIVNLREAARRCRAAASDRQSMQAETMRLLAEEIDAMIARLSVEGATAHVNRI